MLLAPWKKDDPFSSYSYFIIDISCPKVLLFY